MRWSKTIAAFCFAAMLPGVCAAGLLPNGGAEEGLAGWVGDAELSDGDVFAGKYAFALKIPVSGTARMTLAMPFRYGEKPERLYFSGVFYSTGGKAEITVRPLMYDRYGQQFERTAGNPVPGSEARQLVKIDSDGRILNLEWNPQWRTGSDMAVAFYAAADGSDLPNILVREVGIKTITRTDSGMRVALERAPGESFSVSTVRLHRVSRFGEFVAGAECVPGGFRRFSGEIECAVAIPYMSIEITVRGEPGTVVLADNLELADGPSTVAALPDGLRPDAQAHRRMLVFYADFGYRADCFYQDCGVAVDTAAMRLQTAGRSVEAEILRRDSAGLRAAYLRLMERLDDLAESYSALPGAESEFKQRAATLEAEFKHFQSLGDAATARAGELAGKLPPDAPLFPPSSAFHPAADYLTSRFTFGIDLDYESFGGGRSAHPGNRLNPEYVGAALSGCGINLLTLNVIRSGGWQGFVTALNRNLACPFLVWASDGQYFADGDAASYDYFGNVGKLASDAAAYSKLFSEFDRFAGIQLGDPAVLDDNARFGRLTRSRAAMDGWAAYSREVASDLNRQGVKVEISPRRPSMERNGKFPQTVEYFAWQFFKAEYSGEHLAAAFNALSADGLVGTVLTGSNASAQRGASFAETASKVPYIGADLYCDGNVDESFSMQLLKSAAQDRAVMWPGAGYSCKSPAAFERSMAAGLAYGDGVHVWTYQYCAKYRDPDIFWRTGGTSPNLDDRGRLMLLDWSPGMWSAFSNFRFAATDAAVASRKSIAQTAVIFSERQAIFSDRPRGYYDAQVGLYTAAVAANVPCAVELLECLTPERLAGYRVVLAGGLECLSAEQCKMLGDYVRGGGVLVTFGMASARSEWGAELRKPALSDLLGVTFSGVQRGGGFCATPLGTVGASAGSSVLRLNSVDGAKYYLWNTRGIGMVENSSGKGRTYCFALMDGGYFWDGYRFYPGLDQFVGNLAAERCKLPFALENLPPYVEVSARVNDRGELVIVLINRTALSGNEKPVIEGHRLRLASGAEFEVRAVGSDGSRELGAAGGKALPAFENYQLLVVRTEGGLK